MREKMVVFLILILLLFSLNAISVNYDYYNGSFNYAPGIEWIQGLGINNSGYLWMHINQTSDDGFIILVTSMDHYGDFFTLIKKDKDGDNEWVINYEGVYGFSVEQTDDDGYIIGGLDSQNAAFIMKIDEQGSIEWDKSFPRINPNESFWHIGCVQQTQDGGYFFTTDFDNTLDAVKMNNSGVVEWVKVYPAPAKIFYGQQTSDGGYILTGTTDYSGIGDTWVVRLDSMGNDIWDKTVFTAPLEYFTSGGWYISETQDGGYILETTYKEGPWDRDNDCVLYMKIMRLDHLGNVLWKYSSSYIPTETDDQGYITYDDQIVKLDKNLEQEWNISLDEILGEYPRIESVQQTHDKGFIVLGFKRNYDGFLLNYDGFLLKIRPEDYTPPQIEIIHPQKGLYLFNKKILDLPRKTIVFGNVDIQIYASDNITGIDYIQVSVGEFQNATIYNLTKEPYVINWNQTSFGQLPVRVIAYDYAGNQASDEIKVWKFF